MSASAAVLHGRPLRALRQGAILEYVQTLAGGPTWDTVRDRERIDLVWVQPDRELAKRMADEPGWTQLFRDSVSVLYGRKSKDFLEEQVTSLSRP